MKSGTMDELRCHEEVCRNIFQCLRPDSTTWGWDRVAAKSICPSDVVFSDENNTVIFHPSYAFGTAAVFGERPLGTDTIAFWEVKVPRFYGTSMMLGVGSRSAKFHAPTQFEHLLGGANNSQSCGLAHNGFLYGGRYKARPYCSSFPQDREVVIGILFNGPEEWMTYFVDGKPLGIAFSGLNLDGGKLYPMVSSTAQKSQFTMGKQLSAQIPRSLTSICFKQITRSIEEDATKASELNLPKSLAEALQRRITTLQQPLNSKSKRVIAKAQQQNTPTVACQTSPAARRKRRVVHSTTIQEYSPERAGDDELEARRLSRLVVSTQCPLQSLLRELEDDGDMHSLEQKLLKRTRV